MIRYADVRVSNVYKMFKNKRLTCKRSIRSRVAVPRNDVDLERG